MGKKIKGARDYEIARRFNKDEGDFVKRKCSRKKAAYSDEMDFDETQYSDETKMTERNDLEYLWRQGFEMPHRQV